MTLRRAFKKLDKRNDGYLDLSEFRSVLQLCNTVLNEDEVLELLTQLDDRMEGKINYRDFLKKISRWTVERERIHEYKNYCGQRARKMKIHALRSQNCSSPPVFQYFTVTYNIKTSVVRGSWGFKHGNMCIWNFVIGLWLWLRFHYTR